MKSIHRGGSVKKTERESSMYYIRLFVLFHTRQLFTALMNVDCWCTKHKYSNKSGRSTDRVFQLTRNPKSNLLISNWYSFDKEHKWFIFFLLPSIQLTYSHRFLFIIIIIIICWGWVFLHFFLCSFLSTFFIFSLLSENFFFRFHFPWNIYI